MCSSLSIACPIELKTIAIMERNTQKAVKSYADLMERNTQKAVKSYADLMNIEHTAPELVTPAAASKKIVKKQTKVRETSYKKELDDFLKNTATKKFGEVFKSKWTIDEAGRRRAKRDGAFEQSQKNWKKYCVKLYEADFKKECMLEVNGKFFLMPTTIPETEAEIMALCHVFHERIEKEHGKKVPFSAGLYKATIPRFTELSYQALDFTQWRRDFRTDNHFIK